MNEIGDVAVDGIDLAIEGGRAANEALDNLGPWGERLKPGGLLDWIQGGLDLVGMAPGVGIVPDALNTLISLGRGDYQQAGINAFSMIPLVGDAAKGAQIATKAVKAADKIEDARKATKNIDDLVKAAQKKYPKKAGKIEDHHIDPKYMGGDPKGPTTPLDGAYHQEITNEFRKLHPYGQDKLPADKRQAIMDEVYQNFPLPPAK